MRTLLLFFVFYFSWSQETCATRRSLGEKLENTRYHGQNQKQESIRQAGEELTFDLVKAWSSTVVLHNLLPSDREDLKLVLPFFCFILTAYPSSN